MYNHNFVYVIHDDNFTITEVLNLGDKQRVVTGWPPRDIIDEALFYVTYKRLKGNAKAGKARIDLVMELHKYFKENYY